MRKTATKNIRLWPLAVGSLIGVAAMWVSISMGSAAPLAQDEAPTTPAVLTDQECKTCHLDVAQTWEASTHAHAYDDPYFQQSWTGLGNPGECLLCHTTNYQATDNSYTAEGVSCEACHGKIDSTHPPQVAPIRADTEYCGTCHTTTLHEWRLTGHAHAGVGCMDCHEPHSQEALFEVADDLCINCHKEDMERYLEDLHIQKNIGCVDCHALVIPPDPLPVDGIVPTGHTFTITPATCVACHTDALHAGFSLPGFERGPKEASSGITSPITSSLEITGGVTAFQDESNNGLSTEQRIQALETSLASRQLATLFQGSIVGLVLGGSTAWFLARNTRRSLIPLDLSEEESQTEE